VFVKSNTTIKVINQLSCLTYFQTNFYCKLLTVNGLEKCQTEQILAKLQSVTQSAADKNQVPILERVVFYILGFFTFQICIFHCKIHHIKAIQFCLIRLINVYDNNKYRIHNKCQIQVISVLFHRH
jgi:hypothetical protein